MPINRLKGKISNFASGEVLGETEEEREKEVKKEKRSPKPKQERAEKPKRAPKAKEKEKRAPKRKKAPRIKKEQEPKERKESFFKRKKDEPVEEEVKVKKIKEEEQGLVIKEAIEGYEDVLSILNIKEKLDVEADFKSQDMDYIEFNQTTPLGFDFDEVTDFISRVKYTLNRYENALKQRDKEMVIVASEVKKVEQKMVEQNQAKELEKMIGGMTEEEALIEENMNLRIEIKDLENKLLTGAGNSDAMRKLENENAALRAENQMLIKSELSSTSPGKRDDFKLPNPNEGNESKKASNSLPAFNVPNEVKVPTYEEDDFDSSSHKRIENDDSLDDMMKDIGGDYSEER